jgi:NAD(P)H-hydrate epimerase
VNPTGNPGMAKGGTGDVLAGVIAALLARGCDAWTAATAGVFVHGRAGDCAAARLGQESMLASDLLDAVGEALVSVTGARG